MLPQEPRFVSYKVAALITSFAMAFFGEGNLPTVGICGIIYVLGRI